MLSHSPLIQALTRATAAQLQLQLIVLLAAVLTGLFVGTALEKRYRDLPDWKSAWGVTFRHGLAFPILTLFLLMAVRHADESLMRLALLQQAVPVLAVLALVRVGHMVTRRLFSRESGMRYLVRLISIGLWAVLALHLAGLLPELHRALDDISVNMGSQRLSAWTLLRGAAAIALTLLLALWVSSLLEARLMRTSLDASLRLVFTRMLRSVVLVIAVLTALQMVGIDLTVLSVFGGALGVGLGFGLQKIAANYVSGFVILLERSLRVGDNVLVDGFQGRIVDIKTRYTLVRSAGGTDAIIPNENLIANRIENLSYNDPNVWLSTTVGVTYKADMDVVLPMLRDAALTVPRVLKEPAPNAVLSEFGADALVVTIGFWIADPQNGTVGVKGAVNLAAWRTLRDNGVEIPFAQRVLHWADDQAPVIVQGAAQTAARRLADPTDRARDPGAEEGDA